MGFCWGWCCGGQYVTHRKFDTSGNELWTADHGADVFALATNGGAPIVVGGQMVIPDDDDEYDISLWNADGTQQALRLKFGNSVSALAVDASGNIYAGGSKPVGMYVFNEGSGVFRLVGSGPATAGTFTLNYGGEITAPIDWDATAAEVEAELQSLSVIPANGVSCTRGPLPDAGIRVEYTGGGMAPGLAVDSVASLTYPDQAILKKWNSSGTLQWIADGLSATYTPSNNPANDHSETSVRDVRVDGSGNVLVATRVTVGGNNSVIKYNSSGTKVLDFAEVAGAGSQDHAKYAVFDGTDFVVFGSLRPPFALSDLVKYDSSGNHYYTGRAISSSLSGGGARDSSGYHWIANYSFGDPHLHLYDSDDGSRIFYEEHEDWTYSSNVAVDSNDNIAVVGRSTDGQNIRLFEFTNLAVPLTTLWTAGHGNGITAASDAVDCEFDSSDNLYIGGYRVKE